MRASERAGGRASGRRERKLTLRSPPLPLLSPTSTKPRTRSPAFLPDCLTSWPLYPPLRPELARSSEYLPSLARERASERARLEKLRDELRRGVGRRGAPRASGPLLRAVVNSMPVRCAEERPVRHSAKAEPKQESSRSESEFFNHALYAMGHGTDRETALSGGRDRKLFVSQGRSANRTRFRGM